MSKWFKKHPDKEGDYWMKDSAGGPSLYEFIYVDGVLCHGLKCRDWRFPVGEGMLTSCRWKEAK